MNGGKHNLKALLAAVGISFWLAMAGGVSAGPSSNRIVGGDVADPADWPFVAALVTRDGSHVCGGSVVAKDAVVTAAHCVLGTSPKQIRVVTGRPDLTDESAGQELRIAEVTVHQQYQRTFRRDVAVLRLERPTVAPRVRLPTVEEDEAETAPGSELRVAGWGGTRADGGKPSDVLLDVSVFAISDSECRTYFKFFRAGEEVCAFGEPQGEERYDDSCYGDSGGPLVADSRRGVLLMGLVSYGGRLCGVKKPGVYAQVSANLHFIKRKAGIRR
ncbi:MAG: serine protease [Actinomycetota bacterium]|nr:serine protease [Actinomycetota bacterium]